jgi:hypothetical protein
MSRQPSSARFTHSKAARRAISLAGLALYCLVQAPAGAVADVADGDIRLELSPRICTLAADDKQCEAKVHATWQAPREESLCLVIVDRPEIKRCWENYSQGTYNIELIFNEDLIFQLKDPQLQHVLASEALRVIREAIRYRHKRRQPWNIFD